jgi:hypothetical protein
MTIEIYRDFLRHLAKVGNVSLGSAEEPEAGALRKYSASLAVDFHRVLTTCWPTATMAAGPYELWSLREILANRNLDALHARGFFLIGHALNGDLLVIRTGKKWGYETSVCLVSHEHYWSYEMHPDECQVEVAGDLADFFYRAVEDRYMPIDFFCAQEFSKLKEKHGPERPPAEA